MLDESLGRIPITQTEVDEMLNLHADWLYSEGKEGKQAVFNTVAFCNHDFSDKLLCKVVFINSIINVTNFNNAHYYVEIILQLLTLVTPSCKIVYLRIADCREVCLIG